MECNIDSFKTMTQSIVCLYFSADRAPIAEPIHILNWSGKGIVKEMFIVTNVAHWPLLMHLKKRCWFRCLWSGLTMTGQMKIRWLRWYKNWLAGFSIMWLAHGGIWLRTCWIRFAQPDQTPPTNQIGRDSTLEGYWRAVCLWGSLELGYLWWNTFVRPKNNRGTRFRARPWWRFKMLLTHLVGLFEDTNLCPIHARRVMIIP